MSQHILAQACATFVHHAFAMNTYAANPTTNWWRPLLLLLLACTLIIGIDRMVVTTAEYHSNPVLFQLAITIDIALFLPFLYYLSIRRRAVPLTTLVPVFIACLVIASWVLPADGQRFLGWVKWLLVPLEVSIMAYILLTVRRTMASFKAERSLVPGFVEQLDAALLKVFPSTRLAAVLGTEIGVIHYGLFGWRKRTEAGDQRPSTYHVHCSYNAILGVFYFLIALETVFLHLLIARWTVIGAWVLTALSIYGLLFLFADRNAVLRRPILLDPSTLHVRIGMRWRVAIPLEAIVSARIIGASEQPAPGSADLLLLGTSNVALDLDRELVATGLYGITRKFSQLRLAVDDREAFVKALNAARSSM